MISRQWWRHAIRHSLKLSRQYVQLLFNLTILSCKILLWFWLHLLDSGRTYERNFKMVKIRILNIYCIWNWTLKSPDFRFASYMIHLTDENSKYSETLKSERSKSESKGISVFRHWWRILDIRNLNASFDCTSLDCYIYIYTYIKRPRLMKKYAYLI